MRKSRTVSIPWTPILTVALIANLIAGLYYSPLTAVTKVRLMDVLPESEPAIRRALNEIKGKPALQINPNNVASLALYDTAFDDVRFESNPFGRGVVSVRYRTPVARFSGIPNVFIADDGSVFESKATFPDLPLVQVPESFREPEGSIQSRIPWGALAYLAREVSTISRPGTRTIRIAESGRISLGIDGAEIECGMAVDLERKVSNLRRLLEADPELLRQVTHLNLIAPDKPAAKLRKPATPRKS